MRRHRSESRPTGRKPLTAIAPNPASIEVEVDKPSLTLPCNDVEIVTRQISYLRVLRRRGTTLFVIAQYSRRSLRIERRIIARVHAGLISLAN